MYKSGHQRGQILPSPVFLDNRVWDKLPHSSQTLNQESVTTVKQGQGKILSCSGCGDGGGNDGGDDGDGGSVVPVVVLVA